MTVYFHHDSYASESSELTFELQVYHNLQNASRQGRGGKGGAAA